MPDLSWAYVWEWLKGIGALGGLGWFLQQSWKGATKKIERGRHLVDEARPELRPRSSLGHGQIIKLELENIGKGIARRLKLGFTGVKKVVDCPEQLPGKPSSVTTELDVTGAPIFTAEESGPWEITIAYTDRHRNAYRLVVPVDREPRADGGFKLVIHWKQYRNEEPRLGRWALYRLGK